MIKATESSALSAIIDTKEETEGAVVAMLNAFIQTRKMESSSQ